MLRMSSDRRIEYMRLDVLEGAVMNPKRHASLAASFTRFGFADALILDERTGRLVAGHGRRDQLRELHAAGSPAPEGVRTDSEGAWLIPVQRGWSSISDGDAEAFL